MTVPKLISLCFILPCILASCVTSADLRNLADSFDRDLAAAEARSGSKFEEFESVPGALRDLATKQEAMETGAVGATELMLGGLGTLVLGGAGMVMQKKQIHKERDGKYVKTPDAPA